MKAKRSAFKTFYLLYVLVLLALLLGVFFYVRSTMVAYENSGSDRTVERLVREASKSGSELADYLEKNCFGTSTANGVLGDPAARRERFRKTVSGASISVAPAAGNYDASAPVFNVFADGKPFLTLALAETGTVTKLGIMTLSEWEIRSCVLRAEETERTNLALSENGAYALTVAAPDSFTVLLDGREIPETIPAETSALDEFSYVAPFTDVPVMTTRTIEGLTFEPLVTVFNNAGEPVPVTEKNGVWTCEARFASTKEAEELGRSAVDALAIGELWSSFMTNDVGGDAHGLYTVRNECRLMKNTDLYQKATNWANQVDITFVSGHTIDSWTGERVSNYVLYSDDLFSCDVYFEKNMTLRTGAKRTDVFHNRLYFFYNRDEANGFTGWRLCDMAAL